MAISPVGTASTLTSNSVGVLTTGAINMPAGLASGDLLIAAVHRVHDYALTQGTPAGWVFLRNIVKTATSPAATMTDLYYRICDGSEGATGPAFTTATATRFQVQAAAYRGVNTATPFIAEDGQGEPSGSVVAAHSAPAITNTDANAWAVWAAVGRLPTPGSWTPPTGMTERLDVDLGSGTAAVNLVGEWADSAGPVATGAATYSGTTSANAVNVTTWAAFLNPAAAPVLGAPTGVAATVVTGGVDVTYNPASGATRYVLERNGSIIATPIGALNTSYHDSGGVLGDIYRVRAAN